MGSVSPLLAIKETMDNQQISAEFLWIGTKNGLEKQIIANQNIPYKSVASGKLRRYFSFKNFIDPFKLIIGVFQAFFIIRRYKPDVILSAGGFVCVPVIWAAALLGKKSIVHQQDIRTGLANKLMAPFATRITVAFEKSLESFDKQKALHLGNPVRPSLLAGKKEIAIKEFGLEPDLPTVFIIGGSLGAQELNKLVVGSITRLIDFCQIIHVVGAGNKIEWLDKEKFGAKAMRYHQYEFLSHNLKHAFAGADLVICRSGLSTLSELAALQKPTVLIPIPGHQQEENADYFQKNHAAMRLDQNSTTAVDFVEQVRDLIENKYSLERLSQNIAQIMPADANQKYVEFILSLVKPRQAN